MQMLLGLRCTSFTINEVFSQKKTFFHTEEQIKEIPRYKEIGLRDGHIEHEVSHKRKDGTIFPTWHSSTVIYDNEGTYWGSITIARDITEEHRMKEEVIKEREMRDNIIRLNPYAIGIYDIQGKYRESNQAFKNLFQAEPPSDYSLLPIL